MDSILNSIKKLLGITEEYEHFDADIMIHINSTFMVLNQLGIGPTEGFAIKDKTTTWDEYIVDENLNMEAVKTYVYMRVRLMFDPPTSSIVADALNKSIDEIGWRLNVEAENNKTQNS